MFNICERFCCKISGGIAVVVVVVVVVTFIVLDEFVGVPLDPSLLVGLANTRFEMLVVFWRTCGWGFALATLMLFVLDTCRSCCGSSLMFAVVEY